MGQNVSVRGSVVVGSGICVPPTGAVDQCVRQLMLGGSCGDQGLSYESSIVAQLSVSTAGAVGDAFAAIAALSQFTAIEFLCVEASSRIQLRFTLPDASTTDTPNIEGLQIYQFSRSPNAPTALAASGVATLDIIAAGRTSA